MSDQRAGLALTRRRETVPPAGGASQIDRGCVKTLKSQQAGELFSLLPFFRSRPPRYSSSDWRNQEGFSTRRLNACVFAQAGPLTVIGRRRNQATAKTRRSIHAVIPIGWRRAPFQLLDPPQVGQLSRRALDPLVDTTRASVKPPRRSSARYSASDRSHPPPSMLLIGGRRDEPTDLGREETAESDRR